MGVGSWLKYRARMAVIAKRFVERTGLSALAVRLLSTVDDWRVGGIALLLHLLLLIAQASGGPVESSWRVVVPLGNGMADCGSGVAVDSRIVVTNSHVVDGKHVSCEIFQPHTGVRHKCHAHAVDPARDLALLIVLDESVSLDYSPLAATSQAGELTCYGYGGHGVLRAGTAQANGQIGYRDGTRTPVHEVMLSTEPGDSGAGLFNEHGEVAVIGWGGDGESAVGTPVESLRELLTWYTEQTGCRGPWCRDGSCTLPRGGGIAGGRTRPMVPVNPSAPPSTPSQPAQPSVPASTPASCDCREGMQAIAESLKGIAECLAAQAERDKKIDDSLDKINEGIGVLQATVVASATASSAAVVDTDAIVNRILAQVDQRFTDLEGRIDQAAGPYRRLLYFTSDGHPGCKDTDRVANALRDRGYPVTFIYLKPENTTVGDVPRTYMLPEQTEVGGSQEVLDYLSTLDAR